MTSQQTVEAAGQAMGRSGAAAAAPLSIAAVAAQRGYRPVPAGARRGGPGVALFLRTPASFSQLVTFDRRGMGASDPHRLTGRWLSRPGTELTLFWETPHLALDHVEQSPAGVRRVAQPTRVQATVLSSEKVGIESSARW